MDTSNSGRNQARQAGASTPSSQQQGGSSASPTSRQQDQFSPATRQQGGGIAQRGGGMPSLLSAGSPFELFRQLDEDMDRLWNQLWGGGRMGARNMPASRSDVQQMWMPQLEIFERDGKMHVQADLPGMKREDIKLSLENDELVISGERRSSREEGDRQKGGVWHSERSYGSFYRSLPLPEGIDPSTVDASFKDGVLDVCFDAPKRDQQQARSIQIRDGT